MSKLFFVIVGLIVLIVGGLVTVFTSGDVNAVFWLGMALVVVLSCANVVIFKRIQDHIEEIGKI